MIKKIIPILITFGFLLPIFSFAWVEPPENLEGVKEMGEETGEEIKTKLPGILERIWQEEVVPFWQKMGEKVKNWWDFSLFPWLEDIWQKIATFFGQEVEKRKPIIKEEFKKEKEEIKEELPEVGKSLWEKFKELIK